MPGYQSHCTIGLIHSFIHSSSFFFFSKSYYFENIVVDKRNILNAYPITTKNYIPEYHADELVVFQDAQILPIFAFSLV